jgi:cytochrome P450
MTQIDSQPLAYDPTSPEVMDDPAPAHAALREQCPVHRFDGLGRPLYTVARHEDVHAVVSDAETWSNRHGPGIGFAEASLGDMQKEDSPEHERRRQFVRRAFLPQAVK